MSLLPTSELTDEQCAIADRMIAAMEAEPSRTWSPSAMARKVHVSTSEAFEILRDLYAHVEIDCDDRGAWTHYMLLTGARRDRRIREVVGGAR